MPCSPSDLSLNLPDSSGPSIPGFGKPFAMKTPDLSEYLDGFPENLLELLEKLDLKIPPGKFKPQLSINSGKTIFDAIMKLLDYLLPFLMLYKFILPILNLIICIIEVLCAIPNPYKIAKAMIKLFRNCIPDFLNLFPFLALIIMIISLILLLIALIEFIVMTIYNLVMLIIRNIKMLYKSIEKLDDKSAKIIIRKIGAVLCGFQNLFVLLAIFTSIIQTIKSLLTLTFRIPPCDDSVSDCATSDVCPIIVKNQQYTRSTGTLMYLSEAYTVYEIPVIPSPWGTIRTDIRNESWQIFDPEQTIAQKFINITDGYDVPVDPDTGTKPIFFPADANYNASTPAKQAPYTVDLRLFYNPQDWGRTNAEDGYARFIKIKDCIVIAAPNRAYRIYDTSLQYMESGVLALQGGSVYEDDGTTKIKGYESNGITRSDSDGNLNNFLHKPDNKGENVVLSPNDGYVFNSVEYTFKPNYATLLSKNLITAGCLPDLAINKGFVNQTFAADLAIKFEQLNNLPFPDTEQAQLCLSAAIDVFSSGVSEEAAAEMQSTMLACMSNLREQCVTALDQLVGIGFDPCKSDFTIDPKTQFTTKPIKLTVNLRETNGIALTSSLPPEIASKLSSRIKAYPTLGYVGEFTYDGYEAFNADLTSGEAGNGSIKISFDSQLFCRNVIPEDINISPTREIQSLDYRFVYSPELNTISEGDASDGAQPRRDESDLSDNNQSKDGS